MEKLLAEIKCLPKPINSILIPNKTTGPVPTKVYCSLQKLRGLGLQLWRTHREQSSRKLNCTFTRMGMWVLRKKTRACSNLLQKQYRYVSVPAGNTDKYDKKKTVLHLSYPESHSLFQLLKNMCTIAAFGVLKNATSRLPLYHVCDCCGVVITVPKTKHSYLTASEWSWSPAAEAQWPHKSGIKLQSRGLIIPCIAKSDTWVIASRLGVILIMGDW